CKPSSPLSSRGKIQTLSLGRRACRVSHGRGSNVSDEPERRKYGLANRKSRARVFSPSRRDDSWSLFGARGRVRVQVWGFILLLLIHLASLMFLTPFRERVYRSFAQRASAVPVDVHSQNPEPLIKLLR